MITRLEPISAEYTVTLPNWDNEFDVQAFLYAGLAALGVTVRGEVVYKLRRDMQCRFDIAIVDPDSGALWEIIEVKAYHVAHKDGVENTRQGQRYRMFGVPVTFIYGMEAAKTYIAAWARAIKEDTDDAGAGDDGGADGVGNVRGFLDFVSAACSEEGRAEDVGSANSGAEGVGADGLRGMAAGVGSERP